MLTCVEKYFTIKLVIDHITSHKFSIPFYTIAERWTHAIFLFLLVKPNSPHIPYKLYEDKFKIEQKKLPRK